MFFKFRCELAGALLFGISSVAAFASERVAIVVRDEASFEEYGAAVYLEHYLGKLDGVEAGILTGSELEPSLWRRWTDRLRGRDRLYDDPDFRFWIVETDTGTGSLSTDHGIDHESATLEGVFNQEGTKGITLPSRRYSIRKLDRDIILAGEGSGLIGAVYGLLQDHLGFRWYMPGEIGVHLPEVRLSELEDFYHIENAGFLASEFSGLRTWESREWAVANRMDRPGNATRTFRFHHNVRQIFTPDLFDEHPEVFPVWDGQRYRPPENDPNWQPCFGHPKTAEIAADAARAFFDSNPGEISFSVGMNDGNRICECGLCQALVANGRSFRDKPDYSDLVFTFTNRVAELLEETHPEKFIGCLAYHWAENTPSFPVHSRVIPYLTADRAQWIDTDYRRKDQDLIRRWAEAGPEVLGIYDYYYGGSFVIPRVFNREMAESIRFAHEMGIRGFYAELYPRWSLDGPKAWLATQMLWNPDANPETLLDDYYETFFGPAASPMREYFELAEKRWGSQEGRPYWLRYYYQIAQMELFPPEVCVEARSYLDAARTAAGDGEPYAERVDLFSEGFRLTELYSRYYHFIRDLPQIRELSHEEGWRLLVGLLVYADDFEKLLKWKDSVMDRSSLHREGGDRFYERMGFKPEMRLSQWVGPLLEWGRRNEAEHLVEKVIDRIETVFPAGRFDVAREVEMRILSAGSASRNLLANGNFSADRILGGTEEDYLGFKGRAPFDWEVWWRPGTSPGFFLSDKDTYRGALALRAENAVEDYVYVNAEIVPDALYRLSAYAKARVGSGGRVQIKLLWWADDGSLVEGEYRFVDQLPEGEVDEWNRMEVVGRPPAGAVALMAALTVESQGQGDWAVFDGVRLDEFAPD